MSLRTRGGVPFPDRYRLLLLAVAVLVMGCSPAPEGNTTPTAPDSAPAPAPENVAEPAVHRIPDPEPAARVEVAQEPPISPDPVRPLAEPMASEEVIAPPPRSLDPAANASPPDDGSGPEAPSVDRVTTMKSTPRYVGRFAGVFLLASSMAATAARAEEPPVPGNAPPPTSPAPAAAEDGKADPVPPGKKEETPAEGPTKEAKALLLELIARQGSGAFTGEKAIKRFQVVLDDVLVESKQGDRIQTERCTEAFALPDRVRTEWRVDGKGTILAHTGRSGWSWREGAEPRRLDDPEGKDRKDLDDLDLHRRILRLARRVFFLPNLLEGAAPVERLADQELKLKRGNGDEVGALCHVLRVGAHEGDPALVLFCRADNKDPWAVLLRPASREEPTWLLTFEMLDRDEKEKARVPADLRVPYFLELFEISPEAGATPQRRVFATVGGLVVDGAKVSDDLFKFPE